MEFMSDSALMKVYAYLRHISRKKVTFLKSDLRAKHVAKL